MDSTTSRRCPLPVPVALALCLLLSAGVWAQDPESETQAAAAPAAEAPAPEQPTLDAAQIPEFLGEWVLFMQSPRGSFQSDLVIEDVDGKAVAGFSVPEQEPRTITNIARTDTGVVLTFRTEFAGQLFTVNLNVVRNDEGIAGNLGDDAGLFSIPFEGLTKQDAIAFEQTLDPEEAAARRFRGDTGETELTVNGRAIKVRFERYKTTEPDYEQVVEPQVGSVVAFIKARPSKMWTDADLKFGDTVIKAHNAAPNYPGVYSLWLKSVDGGWTLVVNELADVWGTQHDPERDVAEIPLTVTTTDMESGELTVDLEEADLGGVLRIAWGNFEWSTRFTVAD